MAKNNENSYKEAVEQNRNILRGIAADKEKWQEYLTILAYNNRMTPLNAARVQATDISLAQKKVLLTTQEWAKRVYPKAGEDRVKVTEVIRKGDDGKNVPGIAQATTRGSYNHLIAVYPRSAVALKVRNDVHLYPARINLDDAMSNEVWQKVMDDIAKPHEATRINPETKEKETYTVAPVNFDEEDPNVVFAIQTRYGLTPKHGLTATPQLPDSATFNLPGNDPKSLMAYCRDMQRRISQLSDRLDRAIGFQKRQIMNQENFDLGGFEQVEQTIQTAAPAEKPADAKAEIGKGKQAAHMEKPIATGAAKRASDDDPASRREAARAEAAKANASASHAAAAKVTQ